MVKRQHSAWRKNQRREIRHSLGRFLAILAITALGVGFFAGLKVTKRAMISMGDQYISEQRMFDFRLISTLGLTEEDVSAFASVDGIDAAEGIKSTDFLTDDASVIKAISLPQTVNGLSITEGRLPQNSRECIADAQNFTSEDIGTVIRVDADHTDQFTSDTFEIVGLCNSVTYLYPTRGTSTLGGGSVDAFVYLVPDAFTSETYTEIDLKLTDGGEIFSDEYDQAVDALRGTVTDLLESRCSDRYQSLVSQATEEIDAAQEAYDSAHTDYQRQRMAAEALMPPEAVEEAFRETQQQLAQAAAEIEAAKQEASLLQPPVTYVLDRSSNAGYSGFESDSSVVEGIAKVFPLFFFLVAALVCTTTMTRMVDEQRTQIGTLKALGYSNGRIIGKYVTYSGSAAILGCVVGFAAGTKLFPLFIWKAYQMLYHFAQIHYVFDWKLALISLLVCLLCSVGATYAACQKELRLMPAQLMRPKAPKAGKRVLLERIRPLWSRLHFLKKVSIRNIFRYKKRLFMMLLGVGGCTALVLTGFGISDSISNIVNDQFDGITKYELVVSFDIPMSASEQQTFQTETADLLKQCVFVQTDTCEAVGAGAKEVNIIACDDAAICDLVSLHHDGTAISYPTDQTAVVSVGLADALGLSVGDRLSLRVSDTQTVDVPISGICDNYVYHYLYLSASAYESLFGKECTYQTAYATTLQGEPYAASAELMNTFGASSVTVIQGLRDRVNDMMHSLNYIVYLVIGCACALAFIVMYNLNNINITERVREIATIKVLGFYPQETHRYVFRENIVLSAMGIVLGLPAGIGLHRFVMQQIKIDMVSFRIHIAPLSYLLTLAVVFGMALLVDLLLQKKINRINMAESLKSVE